MKTLFGIRAKILIVIIISMRSIGFSVAAQPTTQDTTLIVWATAGPLAYLSGAQIVVKNAKKKTIGKGVTNERGVALIKSLQPNSIIFPLSIQSSGGEALGKKFKGILSAEATSVGIGSSVVFLDLITTSAKRITNNTLSYEQAVQSVRKSLGIGDYIPRNVIRVNNPFVRLDRLQAVEKQSGGFGAVVNQISRAAKAGKPYYRLQQIKNTTGALSGAAPNESKPSLIAINTASTSTSTSSCSAENVNNPPPNGGQPNVIDTYAPILMEELGAYVGLKSGSARTLIPGMIWGTDTAEGQEILAKLDEIQKQLDCIDAKINYVIAQVSALQVQLSMTAAENCYNNAISTNWSNYLAYTNSLDTSDPWDKSSTELLFSGFKNVIEQCGSAIDAGLFSIPSGQTASVWQTKFLDAENKYGGFLFPVDNQGLQAVLSEWNYKTYQYFVLSSEYYNYEGAYSLAGSSGGYNMEDSTFCSDNTTSQSVNFCVYENNIKKAMPATIYSDEVAIVDSGIAVNALPGIAYPGTSCSGSYIRGVCYGYPIPMRLLTAMEIASYQNTKAWGEFYSQPNRKLNDSKPLNTSEVDSAIETYESPRAYRDRYIYNSDITVLLNHQPDVTRFYLDAIKKPTNSVWKDLTTSQVSFGTIESTATISSKDFVSYYKITVNPNAAINNFKSQEWCMFGSGDYYVPCDDQSPPHPTLGLLFGRSWWKDSAKASTYLPPDPRCYMKSVPTGVTCP